MPIVSSMKHALRIANAFAILDMRRGQSRPWGVGTPSVYAPVELLGRVADAHVQGSA